MDCSVSSKCCFLLSPESLAREREREGGREGGGGGGEEGGREGEREREREREVTKKSIKVQQLRKDLPNFSMWYNRVGFGAHKQ